MFVVVERSCLTADGRAGIEAADARARLPAGTRPDLTATVRTGLATDAGTGSVDGDRAALTNRAALAARGIKAADARARLSAEATDARARLSTCTCLDLAATVRTGLAADAGTGSVDGVRAGLATRANLAARGTEAADARASLPLGTCAGLTATVRTSLAADDGAVVASDDRAGLVADACATCTADVRAGLAADTRGVIAVGDGAIAGMIRMTVCARATSADDSFTRRRASFANDRHRRMTASVSPSSSTVSLSLLPTSSMS